jgi:hypothetical protein
LALLIFSGCASQFPSYDTKEPFQRSSLAKDYVLKNIQRQLPKGELFPLYAKGKLDVRQQDRRERGTLELYVYPDSLYAEVKNQVGIAGLQVWMINNRLIIRDRVEKQTYRYRKNQVPDPLIRALVQLPLRALLIPSRQWRVSDIRRVEENSQYLRLALRHQRYILINKVSHQILRVDDLQHYQFPFRRIDYQYYRSFKEGNLPRRFRIFQPSSQTDIFLLLQQLKPLSADQAAAQHWPNDPPIQ